MILTKTEYKEYLLCDKSLWLKKKKPDLYTPGEFSLFLQKILKDGDEVEAYVRTLFPEGVLLSGSNPDLVIKTKEAMEARGTLFQATFETEDGLFAKIDVLKWNTETAKWDIYEVKASTEIKSDLKHSHLKDIAFQTLVTQEALGKDLIGESYIIYIAKEYRREKELELDKLFIFENVTTLVDSLKQEVQRETQAALEMLNQEEISFDSCVCFRRTNGQRCDTFFFFNPEVPEYSVHNIVSGKKLGLLLDEGIVRIEDIPENFSLTPIQQRKVDFVKKNEVVVDRRAISECLRTLVYPLYFLDYETYGSPIPLLPGYKANQAVVFQVSLHKLESDGTLSHFEYLAESLEDASSGLVATLREHIGKIGSIIVWYESFEKSRNNELGELHPEARDFFTDLNERIFDLMKIFSSYYYHPLFQGSYSIKSVLPVMLPSLSYKNLEIQNGTMALSEWEKMIHKKMTDAHRQKTRENLLRYCELDTLAMVELLRILQEPIKEI